MKSNFKIFAIVIAMLFAFVANNATALVTAAPCNGRFTNPITDICWSCIFPMTVGSAPVLQMGQEDNATSSLYPSPICPACTYPVTPGISMGFWEPLRQADVTRVPYCFPALGGISLSFGAGAPMGHIESDESTASNSSLYQAHWYVYPIMFILGNLIPSNCFDKAAFDLAYVSELDPMWNDDELTMILNPDGLLFNNPISQAVCAVDCVTASVTFPLDPIFWCSGCNGPTYPLNGHVQSHIGAVQASTLVLERLIIKLQREMILWRASTPAAYCGPYPSPISVKSDWKIQMTYPIPSDSGSGGGKCCQPLGRTTTLSGVGREIPYVGEDYSYFVFRKRNCCVGVR